MSNKNRGILPYLLGSSTAGIGEVVFFHPPDTIAKRLQSNTTSVFKNGGVLSTLNNVIFREAANASVLAKIGNLYHGLGFAMPYKISQITYKFGGQSLVCDRMRESLGPQLTAAFGKNTGTDLLNACSGGIVGAGEVIILPLDILRIKAQTNPQALKDGLALNINTLAGLYRGWEFTASRNMLGYFTLFGTNSVVYTRILGKERKDCTFPETVFASACAGVSCLFFTSPLDVIKVRIQNKAFDDVRGGVSLFKDLMKNEGPGALFKGLGPKITAVVPKWTFTITLAPTFIDWYAAKLN